MNLSLLMSLSYKRCDFMKKRKTKKSINNILEFPQEVYTDVPKIVIIGFNEIIIENFKGILEYEEFFIRISTAIGVVNINGCNMNLENMSDDDIRICGRVDGIDFEPIIF